MKKFAITPQKLPFKKIIFHSGVSDPNQLIYNPTMKEIAFCGRSNSGKSTLINSIAGNSSLARVSSNPGKTQEINYFNADDRIFLVDLPGFGYSKTSNDKRDKIIQLINGYLNKSQNLTILIILCDSKRELPEMENQLIELSLLKGITTVLVRSKTDLLNQSEMSKLRKSMETLNSNHKNLKIFFTDHKNPQKMNPLIELIGKM